MVGHLQQEQTTRQRQANGRLEDSRVKGRCFVIPDTGQGKCVNSACQINHAATRSHTGAAITLHIHSAPSQHQNYSIHLKDREKHRLRLGVTSERASGVAGESSPGPLCYSPIHPSQHPASEAPKCNAAAFTA